MKLLKLLIYLFDVSLIFITHIYVERKYVPAVLEYSYPHGCDTAAQDFCDIFIYRMKTVSKPQTMIP